MLNQKVKEAAVFEQDACHEKLSYVKALLELYRRQFAHGARRPGISCVLLNAVHLFAMDKAGDEGNHLLRGPVLFLKNCSDLQTVCTRASATDRSATTMGALCFRESAFHNFKSG